MQSSSKNEHYKDYFIIQLNLKMYYKHNNKSQI